MLRCAPQNVLQDLSPQNETMDPGGSLTQLAFPMHHASCITLLWPQNALQDLSLPHRAVHEPGIKPGDPPRRQQRHLGAGIYATRGVLVIQFLLLSFCRLCPLEGLQRSQHAQLPLQAHSARRAQLPNIVLPCRTHQPSPFFCAKGTTLGGVECTCPGLRLQFLSAGGEAVRNQGRGRGARRQSSDARCCNGRVVKYSL